MTGYVRSVIAKIDDGEYLIERDSYSVHDIYDGQMTEAGQVINFPFIPAYAVTIDKSQGLTLDKVVICLGRTEIRDNQIYVALSRARSLNDIYLDREITKRDIHLSSTMKYFYNSIKDRIIPVVHNENTTPINISVSNSNNTSIKINLKPA
jgi:hypothetical protein